MKAEYDHSVSAMTLKQSSPNKRELDLANYATNIMPFLFFPISFSTDSHLQPYQFLGLRSSDASDQHDSVPLKSTWQAH